MNRLLVFILFVITFVTNSAAYALETKGIPDGIAELFDEKAEVVANYSPMLALRGLANSKIYRKKGKAHLERYCYRANEKSPYQKTIVNINVHTDEWRKRVVEAFGTINGHPLYYKNIMEFSFPRKAQMNAYCNVDDSYNLLSLYIESDGNKMTNKVLGYFAGRSVQYLTTHRLSEGVLSGSNYKIYIEGEHDKDSSLLKLKSDGFFDEVKISGEGKEIKKDEYEFVERFGTITVKTFLKVEND